MAYTINLTDGTIFATVADGTINTDSSVIAVGKNYAGYGEFLNENFIRLLESGANSVAPSNPLTGQLWFDKANGVLKVYNGSIFKNLGSASTDATEPTTGVTGDLWFDPVNSQLFVYDGSDWILVGPTFTAGTGTTGSIADIIQDNVGGDHVAIKMYVEDDVVAIVSKDAAYTPGTAIPGFTGTIKPGVNLAEQIGTVFPTFVGTATNATNLNGFTSFQYLRSDENDITTGTLKIQNDTGLYVGADDDAYLSVHSGTSHVVLENQTNNADLSLRVNDGGTPKDVIRIEGATGLAHVDSAPVDTTGIANKDYVDSAITSGLSTGLSGVLFADGSVDIAGNIEPDTNNTRDLGGSTRKFASVWATTFNGQSTSALYADLAERFEADVAMVPGTVVELGGEAEITKADDELTDNVFGVISTQAAYLMNAGAGDDSTHPAVAMNGRVPVRVIGEIRKGDRLVSAGNGLARAAEASEITAFNVIGRALEDKFTDSEGVVEAIVRIN